MADGGIDQQPNFFSILFHHGKSCALFSGPSALLHQAVLRYYSILGVASAIDKLYPAKLTNANIHIPCHHAYSMNGKKKIIHIDMDAFYASVEQLDKPHLRNRPVIVGGNPQKRGVVAACSYEAREYGIHSAMPCSTAARLCPRAIFTAPRMQRYKDISAEVMSILAEFTDLIEPLSLDEAYLDVTRNRENNPSATRIAEKIRYRIHTATGLTASAGVSYNKFLAKIASDLNKPDGISIVPPDKAVSFLDLLPIGKFHGIGKVTEKKMVRLGITHGRDLRRFSKEDLLFHFGRSGAFFYDIVRGKDDRPVQSSRERKSIGSETTLQHDTSDTGLLKDILSHLAAKVEKAMQARECGGACVTLKVRYHDFRTITRSVTLAEPLFTSMEILRQVDRLQRDTEIGKRKIRLLGITLSKLSSKNVQRPVQLMLPFD